MKKISFLVCMITTVFLFISCGKTYDNTTQSNTKENLKQLVMVNEELYYNTEKENTMTMKCGTMDGEIISMVNQDEIPKENNQSNFGKGYRYQIGPQDKKIVLNIDNKWIVFEKMQSDK